MWRVRDAFVSVSDTDSRVTAARLRFSASRERRDPGLVRDVGTICHGASRRWAERRAYSADQTSSFCFVRRMTSSVNSLVPAWPAMSAVRTPSATASRQASRIAREACAASPPA